MAHNTLGCPFTGAQFKCKFKVLKVMETFKTFNYFQVLLNIKYFCLIANVEIMPRFSNDSIYVHGEKVEGALSTINCL